LWQIEAARDGRLSERDKSSFEAHLHECRVCSRERQRLARLAEQLSELEPPADQMSLYRVRQRLRKELDGRARRPARRHWLAVGLCLSASAGLVLLLTFIWARGQLVGPRNIVQVTVLGSHAQWSRIHRDNNELIQLSGDGVFTISIHRKPDDPRVAVLAPDGYIEDVGTTFQVSIHNHKTAQLAVSEGVVVFYRQQAAAIWLAAGHVWHPEAAPKPEPSVVTPDINSHAQPARTSSPPSAVARAQEPESRVPEVQPRSPAPSLRRTQTRPVMQPSLLQREDVAYLRVLSLQHAKREVEARVAAIAYLQQFPKGFRRAEIVRVAAGK